MDERARERHIDRDAQAGRYEGLHPTLPVRHIDSALFRGWGPRL